MEGRQSEASCGSGAGLQRVQTFPTLESADQFPDRGGVVGDVRVHDLVQFVLLLTHFGLYGLAHVQHTGIRSLRPSARMEASGFAPRLRACPSNSSFASCWAASRVNRSRTSGVSAQSIATLAITPSSE